MSAVWIVTTVLAWAVLALLVAVVVTLLRQVGELRARVERLTDEGLVARTPEVALHDPVAPFAVRVLDNGGDGAEADDRDVGRRTDAGANMNGASVGAARTITVGGDAARPVLLVAHAPGCPGCAGIEDALERVAGELAAARGRTAPADDVRIVSVLALVEEDARRHLRERPLRGAATVAVGDLPEVLRPDSTPSLVAVARGRVRALGHPRDAEHLREAIRACGTAGPAPGPDWPRPLARAETPAVFGDRP